MVHTEGDATNKAIDAMEKDKSQSVGEDEIKGAKDEVQEMTKKYETQVDEMVAEKTKQIEEV